MKQTILTLMLALATMMVAAQPQEQSQDGPRFDPREFQQMVEQMLTKAGDLTDDEAKAFFPLYKEMRQKQRQLVEQIRELKHSTPADAKATAATILKIKSLQVDMAEIEQDYYKRILRKVPAEKVFKMMKAEDDFHRRMVKRGRKGNAGKGERHRNAKK